MKFIKVAIVLIPILSITGLAHASVKDGTIISPDTITPLAEWVQDATDIDIVSLPLTIASNHELATALKLKGVQRAQAAAAYLPGQIIINNMIWDPESPQARSYIIHELVHHAQLLSRVKYPCHAAKEREAYMLQNRWLVEQGGEPLVSQE